MDMSQQSVQQTSGETRSLQRGLKTRHIRFIALGATIGTGLFYGSAKAISLAGPSVLLAYLVGGIICYIIMRALGEMTVHDPQAGSFSHYAKSYLGPLAGYLTGWTYCFEILIVAIADATAFGIYMSYWFPDVAQWVWVLTIVVMVGGVNLLNVKVYGELEFWFAFFKVAAIIIMIAVGALIITTGIGNNGVPTGISNLWENGGFFAKGWLGFILSLQLVMFAYGGIEVLGITAGEAEDPKKTIPKAINSVPFRILIFYIGTLFVIMSIYPWDQVGVGGSPFVLTFEKLGISTAAGILNFVVITASLSAINSDIFGVGRILHDLARQGNAPKAFLHISKQGIPWVTVTVMCLAMLFGVVLNWLIPEDVFVVLALLATFATVWVWVMILLSQLAFRRTLSAAEQANLSFPLPGWKILTPLALVFLVFVVALIGYQPETRAVLYVGFVWIIGMTAIYYIFVRKRA